MVRIRSPNTSISSVTATTYWVLTVRRGTKHIYWHISSSQQSYEGSTTIFSVWYMRKQTHRVFETCLNSHDKWVAGMSRNEKVEPASSAPLLGMQLLPQPDRWAVFLSLLITLGVEFSCFSASSLSKLNWLLRSRILNQDFIQVSGYYSDSYSDTQVGRRNFSLYLSPGEVKWGTNRKRAEVNIWTLIWN